MSYDEKNGKNLIKGYDLVNFHLALTNLHTKLREERQRERERERKREREKERERESLLKPTCDIPLHLIVEFDMNAIRLPVGNEKRNFDRNSTRSIYFKCRSNVRV